MTDLSISLLTVLVAFFAGLIRGFSGFGGPAIMLAVMTWFLTPVQVIGKVLVIECIAATFLVWRVRYKINWRTSLTLTLPTMLSAPAGRWILTHTDPDLMRQIISAVILFTCVLMLSQWRYPARLTQTRLIALGLAGGVVVGASYIALVVVAVILMGPYSRHETRTLFLFWGFALSVWYAVLSVYSGHTGLHSVASAMPAAATYFSGSWIGSRWFGHSTEISYRRYTLMLLTALALIGLLH
ncbi:hypothetical protein AB833_01825 [Chromatiales bacterium (ex Bugula neritina AB1)]|nr:hypothetical protein AB833_01825 [Chromatiales bacterium (ex Bugula neritina AB1)]